MRSLKQQAASRINGSKSRGPKTPQGKARSSQNARRHGLLSQMVVTGDESTRSLNDVLARHTLRFGHSDGVEFGIIEEMAAAFWRMRRAWSIEKEWMDQTAAKTGQLGITAIANAFAALAGSDKYRLLDRYEARMHRTYQRLLQTLLKLQAKPARNHDSTEIENEQTNPAEPSTPVELNQ